MDQETLQFIAQQLRHPHGEKGVEIGEMMNQGNRLINLATIDVLRLQNYDHVIEIGMGNGFFVQEILARGPIIKYVGCDFSETMVAEAIKYNQQYIKNNQVQFHLTAADNLPFKNEIFDKAFTINTIYFWENPNLVLAELHRILKPDGKIYISIRPKADMQHYPMTKYGFKMFSKNDLENLLDENQFRLSDCLEIEEPDQEILGVKLQVHSLIVIGEKI